LVHMKIRSNWGKLNTGYPENNAFSNFFHLLFLMAPKSGEGGA